VNIAGWALLTAVFGGLLLLVQRTERKRRNVTLGIMVLVGLITLGYANFRISTYCPLVIRGWCAFNVIRTPAAVIARNTILASIVSAVLLNIVFWVLFGRSNPPGTSESIQVFGMDD
jgi:hypothetical protein